MFAFNKWIHASNCFLKPCGVVLKKNVPRSKAKQNKKIPWDFEALHILKNKSNSAAKKMKQSEALAVYRTLKSMNVIVNFCETNSMLLGPKNSPAKNSPGEELSSEELSVLCQKKFERRILRRRTVRRRFIRSVKKKIRVKNSPAKNCPGEELSGEELST
jgi:hypothetical protein